MKRFGDRLWTLLFAASTVGIALTAHRHAWQAWRWAFWVAAGIALCGGWIVVAEPIETICGKPRGKGLGLWILLAVALAILAAVAYRWGLGETWLPTALGWFSLAAMGIGAVEELLWRGWMQGALTKSLGPWTAVLAASGSHAAYKTALFIFPPDEIARQSVHALLLIAGLTFGFGVVLGFLRLKQGTIAAPVVFHVLFDLLVYGQYSNPPWWVWR